MDLFQVTPLKTFCVPKSMLKKRFAAVNLLFTQFSIHECHIHLRIYRMSNEQQCLFKKHYQFKLIMKTIFQSSEVPLYIKYISIIFLLSFFLFPFAQLQRVHRHTYNSVALFNNFTILHCTSVPPEQCNACICNVLLCRHQNRN